MAPNPRLKATPVAVPAGVLDVLLGDLCVKTFILPQLQQKLGESKGPMPEMSCPQEIKALLVGKRTLILNTWRIIPVSK